MAATEDDLIEDLHRINEITDEPYPTTTAIKTHGDYSLSVYYRVFDGINDALDTAGIGKESQRTRHGTDQEELLTEIQRVAEKLDHTPTGSDINDHGKYSYTTYFNHFESWNAALEKAGFEKNRSSSITQEELIEDLHQVNDRDDVPHLTTTAIRDYGEYSLTTLHERFGGIEQAVEAAGIERPDDLTISEEEIIAEIQRLSDGGTPPSAEEMNADGEYSARTCIDRFGSWNAAVRAAGYEPRHDAPEATRDELLDEIQRLHGELGHPPSTGDMIEHGEYTASRYFYNFDSWNAAIEEAGYTPNDRVLDPVEQRIPVSELLDELQRVASEVDGRPTAADMNDRGKYTTKPYYTRFGSWNRAVEIAGYTPFTGTSEDLYSTEELLTEVRRVADVVGRTPTSVEMDEYGAISSSVYQNRFESWIASLREAGLEPREEQLRSHRNNT